MLRCAGRKFFPANRISLSFVLALFALLTFPCRGAELNLRADWVKKGNQWVLHIEPADADSRLAANVSINPKSPTLSNPKLIAVVDTMGKPVSFQIAPRPAERSLRFIELIFPQLQRPGTLSLRITGLILQDSAGRTIAYNSNVVADAPVMAKKSAAAPPQPYVAGPIGGGAPRAPETMEEHATPSLQQLGGKKAKSGRGPAAAEEPSATPSAVKKDGNPAGDSVSPGIPEFKIPPPLASASQEVPRNLLVGDKTQPLLGDAEAALNAAFEQCGYSEKSYYALREGSGVRDGFALASRMERINPDGSTNAEDRWLDDVPPMRKFSTADYVAALFRARPGHYRVIVFVLTNKPLTQDTDARVNSDQAKLWPKKSSGWWARVTSIW